LVHGSLGFLKKEKGVEKRKKRKKEDLYSVVLITVKLQCALSMGPFNFV
jgi:hypothetical protein